MDLCLASHPVKEEAQLLLKIANELNPTKTERQHLAHEREKVA